MKHLFTARNRRRLVLSITMLALSMNVTGQFQRTYDLKIENSSVEFGSSGVSVQAMKFSGKESYFVGGNSVRKANPILTRFDLKGNFIGGVKFQIDGVQISQIKEAQGHKITSNSSIDLAFPGIALAGTVSLSDGSNRGIFIRTDIYGNPLAPPGETPTWKSYGPDPTVLSELVTFRDKDSREGIIMVGTRNAQGYIIKTDTYGNLIKSKLIAPKNFITSLISIEKTKDKNFLIAGKIRSIYESMNLLCLIKIDRDLNIIWSKEILLPSTLNVKNHLIVKSIKEDQDNNFLVLSELRKVTNISDRSVVLTKHNSNGNIIWSRIFKGTHEDLRPENLMVVNENSKSKYIISGERSSTFNHFMLKVNENGTLKWSFTDPTNNSGKNSGYVKGLTTFFNDQYVSTGRTKNENQLILKEVIHNGWISNFGQPNEECPWEKMDISQDEVFLYLDKSDLKEIEIFDYKEHEISYEKIGIAELGGCWDEGKTERDSDSEVGEKDIKVKSYLHQNYPNPTKGESSIRYELPEGVTNAAIHIFDLQGREVKVFNNLTRNGEVQISSADLQKGLYNYSLTVEGQLIETKKMLVGK